MQAPTGIWQHRQAKYTATDEYVIGKVAVATAFYDGMGPRDDPNKYRCECLLPGIKRVAERFATIEEAKARAERQVAAWFGFLSA